MYQISSQRIDESIDSRVKAYSVIDTSVVDQNIDAAETPQSLLHGIPAGAHICQITLNKEAFKALCGILTFQCTPLGFTAIHIGNSSSLGDQATDNSKSNAFGSASDECDFAVQSKFHRSLSISIRLRSQNNFATQQKSRVVLVWWRILA
jgi:hypothetical protein